MYDLVIKGGRVIDPANRIAALRDIAVNAGHVAEVAPSIGNDKAHRAIDASGKVVTPGLIDIHAHIAETIMATGLSPDLAGVLTGVTTVCDGGSTGCSNFASFRKYVASGARTDIFCFLNVSNFGEVLIPEFCHERDVRADAIEATIRENRDMIKGIKIRVTGALVRTQGLGFDAVKTAKRIGVRTGLPVMVHVGIGADDKMGEEIVKFTHDLLAILEKGDIISHVYTWQDGGFFGFKPLVRELETAMEKGVLLDTANNRINWSFDIAKRAIANGILPTIVSTDMSRKTMNGPAFSLPVTMSKMIAAGLTLEQVVEMTTINPARAIGEEKNRGSLSPGMPADISIFRVEKGNYTFHDGIPGKTFKGETLIVPELVFRKGTEFIAQPRFAQAA